VRRVLARSEPGAVAAFAITISSGSPSSEASVPESEGTTNQDGTRMAFVLASGGLTLAGGIHAPSAGDPGASPRQKVEQTIAGGMNPVSALAILGRDP
jgi:hypothetical protein